ncbi:hypothetical protein DICPUDRAFT_85221 [Dictyostelium purpureum]|uniref:Uncharacterized protein n=1 Tax=Dictyostelium purpureum TaxID=5786 RepID=F1A530_DICPU|nr:uncharacterized protein DICPUDRAFT_85221 [Dictyostelium purpureum]EGC28697.1 hypothetical protein DICPUDRAFT_85221 [Dictyostelium purpureum]|eukprot:XP_003294773.1 hypothetical protein DICPUDRAFT_85221 [Dictyostelium purpureum]
MDSFNNIKNFDDKTLHFIKKILNQKSLGRYIQYKSMTLGRVERPTPRFLLFLTLETSTITTMLKNSKSSFFSSNHPKGNSKIKGSETCSSNSPNLNSYSCRTSAYLLFHYQMMKLTTLNHHQKQ